MVRERDTVELHRLQGAFEVLNDIITIPGEAKKYITGLSNGTMKKIQ